MKLLVQSMASISGLGIWHCCELWCRSQMQVKSGIAVAVMQASGYSSDYTPSLGTSICLGGGPRKDKKNPPANNKCRRGCGEKCYNSILHC